ncbi:MAG: sigma-70 family RNA polymerase sigma factor [Planctomycetales bacterium]|nr:sigma-70 family RNA polymerase sigma factor [Planctomycetales bacterium]
MTTDGQIIADVLAGARERFEEIVRRYQLPLSRVAESRLGRQDWAEEAVQETFYWAFKSLHTYDSQYSFRTWLWTILLNQCRRSYQRMQRRRLESAPDELLSAQEAAPAETPLARMLTQESHALLHAGLRQLPDAQADAVRLRFFGGLKFREIADAMDCGLSTAKCRVRLGLTQLSAWIREHAPHEADGAATLDDTLPGV